MGFSHKSSMESRNRIERSRIYTYIYIYIHYVRDYSTYGCQKCKLGVSESTKVIFVLLKKFQILRSFTAHKCIYIKFIYNN